MSGARTTFVVHDELRLPASSHAPPAWPGVVAAKDKVPDGEGHDAISGIDCPGARRPLWELGQFGRSADRRVMVSP